jgi:soluble lytic murein transglycosylase-like protein
MLFGTTATTPPIRREPGSVHAAVSLLGGIVLAAVLSYPTAVESVGPAAPRVRAIEIASVATIFDALSKCGGTMKETERWRVASAIHQESRRYGYDPLFVAAMIEVESRCTPSARGIHGAIGLIQIRPATARAVAAETGIPWRGDATLRDGVSNVRIGMRYLWNLENQFADPHIAVAAYNLGPTRVARMARHRAQRTQYVKRVLARYENLVKQYS